MLIRLRARLLDPALVAGIAVFTALVSQRWTGLQLDSMFYASLALFGDDATDRAVIPSYYSTRLGYIVPVRSITSVFGTWVGFEAYRFLLLLAIAGGLYVICRRFAPRWPSVALTTMLMMNTVVLTYVGNPYVTGTVLAGTSIVLASALFGDWRAYVVAGVALGWLAMAHPPGVLLAGTVWVAMCIHQRVSIRVVGITVAAAAVTFVAFLGAGRVIFPRMNWFDTYITWNAKLTYSDFASKEPVWLHDIGLLVPVMVLVIAIGVWFLRRNQVWAQLALIVSLTSIGFMLVFNSMMGGVALEAPMYQAALWMPTLASVALVGAGLMAEVTPRPAWLVAAVVVVLAVLVAGHSTGALPAAAGIVVAILCAALVILAAWRCPRIPATRGAIVLVLTIGLSLCAAQLLQNSRRTIGLYPFTPYSNAFVANPFSEKMHAAVNAQQWLLDHTSSSDQILNWVDGNWVGGDRELYMVAGMQLWGENRVTLEPTLTPDGQARLVELHPSVLQLVGPTVDGILRFWSSLPAQARATPPRCYDFAWPGEGFSIGHSCLTRLQWSRS